MRGEEGRSTDGTQVRIIDAQLSEALAGDFRSWSTSSRLVDALRWAEFIIHLSTPHRQYSFFLEWVRSSC